ncbi:MAG TPA: type VI secretion system tip protein VgrG [Gammaproteobacteria bacterium]|nr:type VI secretion system tip protein VgrG [Gammaproteobacteria bacterium]
MGFTQVSRHISIDTPLGSDVLLLESFKGDESISGLFHFELALLSERHDIKAQELIGQQVTLSLKENEASRRYFHGYVVEFNQQLQADLRLRRYSAVVVPWLWFLQRRSDCRIFQHKNVPEIIEAVFRNLGFNDFELRINATYLTRIYCVQYGETDFAFVSRLMEEEGIYYFFEHQSEKHTLILADSVISYKPCPEAEIEVQSGFLKQDHISRWDHRCSYRSGQWAQNDYNFETPRASLNTQVSTLLDSVFAEKKYQQYDYPGRYDSTLAGDELTLLRMQMEEVSHETIECDSTCRTLKTSGTFKVKKHADKTEVGRSYAITTIWHEASDASYLHDNKSDHTYYRNTFTCIPAETIFRPPVTHPKRTIHSTQTAVVVGPKGEEIYTDEYGRVKVQFHWDRVGENNEMSSCWIRVAQSSAGNKWGAVYVPRIGQEVLITFLDGDPDRPLITGSVYNAYQMPPYNLPANKTQSGVRTRSSKGASAANFNEMRFEDRKGDEHIFVHAEKDHDIQVKNDRREHIFNDRHKTVEKDQYEITKRDHHTVIGKDRIEEVQSSSYLGIARDYVQKIGQNVMRTVNGGEMHRVKGSRTRDVMGSEGIDIKRSRSVKVGNELYHKGPNLVYEGEREITIKAPGGFIKIDASGVTIVGKKVKINEGGSAGVAEIVPSSQPNEPEKPRVADVAVDVHGRIKDKGDAS